MKENSRFVDIARPAGTNENLTREQRFRLLWSKQEMPSPDSTAGVFWGDMSKA